jgi:cell fate regulator YaaT (PSP1 superfamily)
MTGLENVFAVHVAGKGTLTCRLKAGTRVPGAGDTVIVAIDDCVENGVIVDDDPADHLPAATFIRLATEADLSRIEANRAAAKIDLGRITERVRASGLSFKPLNAHYSLNHDRFAIQFGCDEDLDDKRIIALIPVDIKARIDLKKVWPRELCAMIGGIGCCGRAYCCCTWQNEFIPVNIRMAKMQNIPLLATSLNGGCERIKCCLRFEYDQYCEAADTLPPLGTEVEGAGVRGVVVGGDVLRGIVTVQTGDDQQQRIPVAELRRAPAPRGGCAHGSSPDRSVCGKKGEGMP